MKPPQFLFAMPDAYPQFHHLHHLNFGQTLSLAPKEVTQSYEVNRPQRSTFAFVEDQEASLTFDSDKVAFANVKC